MDENTAKNIAVVAAGGAIGGMLGFFFSLYLGHEPKFGAYLDAALWMAMGTGAGLIFIFLMANTDRTDRARLISLALVAGFFWQPVLEGSKALVERNTEDRTGVEAIAALQSARSSIDEYNNIADSGSVEDKASLLADIRSKISEAELLAGDLDRISTVEKVARASENLFASSEANSVLVDIGFETGNMLVLGNLENETGPRPLGSWYAQQLPQNRINIVNGQNSPQGRIVAIGGQTPLANPFEVGSDDSAEEAVIEER